jgi:hypothetical protein
MASRAAPHLNLTNWDTCTGLANLYTALREFDPHHVTIGAVQSSDLWSFSDGPGALSIDVSMIENCERANNVQTCCPPPPLTTPACLHPTRNTVLDGLD